LGDVEDSGYPQAELNVHFGLGGHDSVPLDIAGVSFPPVCPPANTISGDFEEVGVHDDGCQVGLEDGQLVPAEILVLIQSGGFYCRMWELQNQLLLGPQDNRSMDKGK
jgi:hypothetical protein